MNYVFGKSLLFASILLVRVAAAEVDDSQLKTPTPAATPKDVLEAIDESGVEHKIIRPDFERLPRHSIKVNSHNSDAEFQGVLLVNVLKSAGVKFGSELKGRRAPTVAVFEATDGYRVAMSLLEIDPDTNERLALIADRREGKLLDAHQGPYRLIVPGEKREVRWIRNLRTIQVVNLIDLPLRDSTMTDTTPKIE